MAVKIKEAVNSMPYRPRFDFDIAHPPNDESTATIKELLHELNHQKQDDSIADYNLKSLGTTLRFVCVTSGIEAPKSVGHIFPVTAIKTIKLLFKSSQFIDAHLIRIIEIPGKSTPATIDFFTSPANPASEDVKRQISRMISALAREIDPDEIAMIDEICDPRQLREQFLQDTNEAVDRILLTHIHIDDDLISRADDYLSGKTREFLESLKPLKREARLHVSMYTYLRLLDYVHRLHFERRMQFTIPYDRGVGNKQIDCGELCGKLSASRQTSIALDTNFMSMDDAAAFAGDHASEIARLVADAVGSAYNRRDVLRDKPRVLIALQLYLFAASLPNDQNQRPVGLLHVVAAYCSVLHQRKLKSKPDKTSRKYGSKFAAPQKLLDEYIAGRAMHIPWTVKYTYLARTKWYVHALLGRKDKADSHQSVQSAQSELMRDIFMSLDHAQIRKHTSSYRDFVTDAARQFIRLHGKQDTIYAWKHGA